MQLEQIIELIEQVAPRCQQESWDNSGLQIDQSSHDEIDTILLCVDVSEAVIDEAIEKHCGMIISHHPLFFRSIRKIDDTDTHGRVIIKAIKHNLAIYSSHTTMDKYLHGVSGRMAEKLGMRHYEILNPMEDAEIGLGVIGELDHAMTVKAYLGMVKQNFGATFLRYACPENLLRISRVALCGGSGAEFIKTAIVKGADAFITADMKYHEMQMTGEQILIVDMDHWTSEHFVVDIFAEILSPHLKVIKSEKDKSPIEII